MDDESIIQLIVTSTHQRRYGSSNGRISPMRVLLTYDNSHRLQPGDEPGGNDFVALAFGGQKNAHSQSIVC